MAVWRWVWDSAHSTGYGDDELGCWLFEWELLCRSKEEGIIDGAVCCSSNRRVAASNSSVNGCLVLMNAWSWFARLISWVAGMDMRLDAAVPASGGKVHSKGRQLSDHCRLSVSGWESLLSGMESRGRTEGCNRFSGMEIAALLSLTRLWQGGASQKESIATSL